jgi:hypothetical protein
VGASAGAVGNLRVALTVYNRINDTTELQQAANAIPAKNVRGRYTVDVTAGAGGRVATTCATVLPDADASAPTAVPAGATACPAGAPTVVLMCTPDDGICGDIYPVSVALLRQGSDTPLARFTTFLTYQEPGLSSSISSTGGKLRVGLVMPVKAAASPSLSAPSRQALNQAAREVDALSTHFNVPLTVAADPVTMTALVAEGRGGRHARTALTELTEGGPAPDQLLAQPYAPINLAALSGAGLGGEIGLQMARGTSLLHQAGLHPVSGPWVDTGSTFAAGQGGSLASGLTAAGTDRLVVNDTDLVSAATSTGTSTSTSTSTSSLTFAQPFTLPLGHGHVVTAIATDSQVDALFTRFPNDPVLAANQILAALEFIHFENPFKADPRGVVVEPPASWQPSAPLLNALLGEIVGNPALSPVTLDQLFTQVPRGGNHEPATRHLQAGPAPAASRLSHNVAIRLATERTHLASFSAAVHGRQPASLTTMADLLLATENRSFTPAQRATALGIYTQRFNSMIGLITLAAQGSLTFTSRTAAIPITVLSAEPFPVKVVVSLVSDKFSFPDGSSRSVVLDRSTTPVRLEARSRTSGDRLPVEVTVTTPDGGLTIAHADLTVHATSISFVGIALTLLAALVLVVWWVRTWRRGRRRRPRIAPG